MPIKTITYKQIKNLGNYESKTLEATSVVNEADDPITELKELIAFVENELFSPKPASLFVDSTKALTVDTEELVEPPF